MIDEGTGFEDLDVWVDDVNPRSGPRVIQFSSRLADNLQNLAVRLGLQYSEYPSLRILPALASYVASQGRSPSPPPAAEDSQLWDAHTMRWRDTALSDRRGLFRSESFGRWQHTVSADGVNYFHTDLRVGRYLELARLGVQVLKFRPDGLTGRLLTPTFIPLPALHARAATLCTGFLPTDDGHHLIYPNVPKVLADAIAASLGQTIETVDTWSLWP
jgi:hypothetical protein